jgi:hypothetical protein
VPVFGVSVFWSILMATSSSTGGIVGLVLGYIMLYILGSNGFIGG